MSKIYTKTGDKGHTNLLSGERVLKTHARVEAYGTVDELNATLGSIAASLEAEGNPLLENIITIQSSLFEIGSWLAAAPGSDVLINLKKISDTDIQWLESEIDRMQSRMPRLAAFILPGGDPVSAQVHIARTVCRRAERRVVGLKQTTDTEPDQDCLLLVIRYLNRLADFLFVLARFINTQKGNIDRVWKKPEIA